MLYIFEETEMLLKPLLPHSLQHTHFPLSIGEQKTLVACSELEVHDELKMVSDFDVQRRMAYKLRTKTCCRFNLAKQL